MVTRSKKRKSPGAKRRFIGKPTGQIQQRVQAVGPEHFGVVTDDYATKPVDREELIDLVCIHACSKISTSTSDC